MIINDISKSRINEKNVVDVSIENNFTLKVCNIDETIDTYKYNNEQLIQEDIKRINRSKNLVLHG